MTTPVEAASAPARPVTRRAAAVLASLRPHQWTKNLVVFAALGETGDRVTQRVVALADQDLALEIQDGDVTDLSLDDLHGGRSPGIGLRNRS